ncbi:glyoxalase [Thermaerobacter sp. PB12/4term]|uniref:VOC family protein n=1 Tax=Thermaerobacter sp. PB12/4term TaxID=2293838 RepID=UPI000E329B36|nr:VOC family protein [Thermaerobacter sp. PB12/4term]QIA26415.1 glyoxalase [Thermaerobacter sp. PB12/4term]
MNPTPPPATPLPASLRLGPVYLRVRQLSRALAFYRDRLGLVPVPVPRPGEREPAVDPDEHRQNGGAAAPGAAVHGPAGFRRDAEPRGGAAVVTGLAGRAGEPPLICLEEDPGAPPRPPRTTGLYHVALLYPSRGALARAFLRLLECGWRFQGFADHGVSEALYLADPEGNGLELYCDRPRDRWPRRPDGTIAMYTAPLDLDDLAATALVASAGRSRSGAAPGNGARAGNTPRAAVATPSRPGRGSTPHGHPNQPSAVPQAGDGAVDQAPDEGPDDGPVVGHVHLQVASLAAAEAFYCGVLGFEVTQRDFPGALFVAAGGYHHHLGLNIWAGEGAPPPPPGAAGLAGFTLALPGEAALATVLERIQRAGLEARPSPRGWTVLDPSGIPVHLTAPPA